MFRFINFFILIATLAIFAVFFQSDKITQEVLDLFPKTKDKEIIEIYQKFSNSRSIVVASKGFDAKSHATFKAFLEEVAKIPNIENILTHTKAKEELEEFLIDNYLFIAQPEQLDHILSYNEMKDRITRGLENLRAHFAHEEQIELGVINKNDAHSNDFLQTRVFNPADPLMLFNLTVPASKILIAKDYGYIALLEMQSISEKDVKETWENFQEVLKKYPDIRYFSSNFMSVVNLDLILKEVNFLLTFSALAFIIIYFVIIRIPLLTINTICTLAIANLLAVIIVQLIYPQVTIMALSFGMGISNIAIDYMMHHNFFNLYAQRAKLVFNKPVFYGYITTIIGFSACLFIPFPLLAQLSLYAIISLTVCYISFAFIYPSVGFGAPKFFPKLDSLRLQKLPHYWFLSVAFCGFVVSGLNLEIDFDLSKLDYQNKAMLAERDFFAKSQKNTTDILLSSTDLQGLIILAKTLQEMLNTQTGQTKTFIPLSLIPSDMQIQENTHFLESSLMSKNKQALTKALPKIKAEFLHAITTSNSDAKEEEKDVINELFARFQESYTIPTKEDITIDKLTQMGFNITHDLRDSKSSSTPGTRFYYLANIHNDDMPFIQKFSEFLQDSKNIVEQDKNQEILSIDERVKYNLLSYNCDIEPRTLQNIMDNLAGTVYKPMFIILTIALVLMMLMLLITTKSMFFDSVSFVLFPLSCALCVIAFHSALNIMHLFALLILVVISIDYGIYTAKENNNPQTTHAVFFSVITTGISFGILIIADTKALNSFGEVIFTGMICILAMLLLHKSAIHSNKTT